MSSHTIHKSCKVITVPFVQTVTSWSSTECPTACSPPVPVSSTRKWNKWQWTYRKQNTQRLSPMAKRGWTISLTKKGNKKHKTHILSLLLQKLDLLFIHLNITRFSWGFLCSFSTLWEHKIFLNPQQAFITPTPHCKSLKVVKYLVTN